MGRSGKIVAKLKTIVKPHGYSRIRSGHAKGIYWSHAISDLRYLSGDYEPEVARFLLEKIRDGYSFMDIGANAGYYSILACRAARNLNQQIIAIEPMEQNVSLIRNHIEWNNCRNIQVLPIAVSDTDRELDFSASSNMAANTYQSQSTFYQNSPKIKIQSRSVDSICNDYTFEKLLLKIDVEGAEADVLRGAKATLQKLKPEIILATHECHVKGVEAECLSILREAGYSCTEIDDQKFVEGQADYFCIPD